MSDDIAEFSIVVGAVKWDIAPVVSQRGDVLWIMVHRHFEESDILNDMVRK